MKKTLLVFVASMIYGAATAQLEYSQSYFRLTPQDGVYFAVTSDGSSLAAKKSYTGATSQQWAIMPQYIMRKNGVLETHPSQEYIIASRLNAKILSLISIGSITTGHVNCSWPFNGNDNQLFKLNTTGAGSIYTISSPVNVNKVIQVFNGPSYFSSWPILFNNISSPPTGKQKFSVTPSHSVPYSFANLTNKRIDAIPFPAAPTSFTQVMPTETPKTFVEEVLIPYPLIKNEMAYTLQVENSLYYKLVHTQYYRRAEGNWDVTYPKNATYTQTLQVKIGTLQSQVNEITTKLDISFSSNGEVNFSIFGIGFKLSSAIGAAFSKTVKQVTTWQETYEKTESFTSTFNTGSLDRRVVTYQLVDHYELYRAIDQTTPALTWEVGRDETTQVFHEGNASGGGRIAVGDALPPISYRLVDGKMIVKHSDDPLSTSEITEQNNRRFSVYPNPSKGIYNITTDSSFGEKFGLTVYNERGSVVYEEQNSNRRDAGTISLDLTSLPPGKYLLKVSSSKKAIVEWIIKE